MRKLRAFLAIAAVATTAAFTTGCGDYVGVEEMNKVSFDIAVNRNDWIWNRDMGSYVYTFEDISQLTPYIIKEGFYHTYLYRMDGTVKVRETLPYIEYGEGNNGLWQRHFACDYSPYAITFYIRNADFFNRAPETLTFRFVAVW